MAAVVIVIAIAVMGTYRFQPEHGSVCRRQAYYAEPSSARIRSIRACPPLQTIADGYASVAYVNNDHPAHFGDTFLVIIDIKWRKSSHSID